MTATGFVLKVAATAGLRVGRISRTLQYRRSRALKELGTTLVLDVGANEGQYAKEIRKMGYAGRIVSFEPLEIAFQRLRQHAAADSAHQCHHIALGSIDGVAHLNVSENLFSSSLLEVGVESVRACPASARVGSETIQLKRLDSIRDDILRPADRIHLKLDTQGTEREVLLGALKVLAQVHSIEAEMSLVPLYRDQVLMPQMYQTITELGFRCVWLERGFTDAVSGDILQMDGLFLRSSPRDSA